MAKTKSSHFAGRWHITDMEMWDAEYINMEVEAFIEFDGEGMGNFQFGLVKGDINYELSEQGGTEIIEWTWEGTDEMEPASGRGRAILKRNKTLKGRIFLHQGDASNFSAEWKQKHSRSPRV